MDHARFATKDAPIRASSLVNLAQCAPSVLLRAESVDTAGEAAETGSLIHLGIKAYHETNERVALAVMAGATQQFPRANGAKARLHFEKYCRTERKSWGRVILCEHAVTFTVPAAEADPTQAEVVIQGTLDQVRELDDGTLVLVDVKTGSKRADEILHYYAPQIAAYQYAVTKLHPGRTVKAAILRTLDFIYGGPILHYAQWDASQCLDILQFVRDEVAQVRAGRRVYRPGGHCKYCPAKGIENCTKGYIPSFNATLPSVDSLTPLGEL